MSGFGGTGPYAPRGGYDLIAQGMSGIISVTGDEDAPAKSGVPLSDLCAGLFAAYGILCALEYRERTGLGQLVDTSLLEAAMALTVWESTEYWVTGRAPKPLGSAHRLTAPYQAVRAADGYFNIGANNDKLFEGLCQAIGRPDLCDDARFATSALRMEHRAALIEAIEKTTAGEPRAHWLARLDHAGSPRVRSIPMRKHWSIRTRWRGRWWSTSCTRARGRSRPSAFPSSSRTRPVQSIAPRRSSGSTPPTS